ncbi:MAG: MurR/RpiR family transcriptional regulator [Gammaproteobacteria bacterium]|nr:MurR/RpiR family transcriptional regulator [Gammaproteobacteria bacterium]MDH5302653.1 MurR/RpiR family transcriptional regulator [Gammaproteobacteria bacterium]MDH5320910.1 MurR/RpiR family transcriptional regulator [Gammaproteobacteria bacterium]
MPIFVELSLIFMYFYYMLGQIERHSGSLSRAEQRVARWVLSHPRQAASGTLAELAMACGTSQPTVIRFCRRIGVTGFREFTRRLTEALSQPVSNIHRDVNANDTASDATSKVLDASIRTLIDIRAQLSSMPFDAAVEAMRDARQIAFVGLGASGHVASDACQKFFRLGLPCTALVDTPTILQYAAITTARSVLIIASQTGGAVELSRAAGVARNNGAVVIALTDPDSTLAAAVDILFACRAQPDANVYTPMSSRLAHLALLDALQVSLAIRLGDKAVDNLRRCKDALAV